MSVSVSCDGGLRGIGPEEFVPDGEPAAEDRCEAGIGYSKSVSCPVVRGICTEVTYPGGSVEGEFGVCSCSAH